MCWSRFKSSGDLPLPRYPDLAVLAQAQADDGLIGQRVEIKGQLAEVIALEPEAGGRRELDDVEPNRSRRAVSEFVEPLEKQLVLVARRGEQFDIARGALGVADRHR